MRARYERPRVGIGVGRICTRAARGGSKRWEARDCTSSELLTEFSGTIRKPKLARFFTDPDRYVRLVTDLSSLVVPEVRIEMSRDPDDDRVLEAAIAAGVDMVVTGDADLLVLGQYDGIPILTAAEALARVERP